LTYSIHDHTRISRAFLVVANSRKKTKEYQLNGITIRASVKRMESTLALIALKTQYFTQLNRITKSWTAKASSTRIQILLNPQLFLSGHSFLQHASGEFGGEIHNESDNVWTVNLDTLESDDVANLWAISYRTINQDGVTTCWPSFSRVNPNTIGCLWT